MPGFQVLQKWLICTVFFAANAIAQPLAAPNASFDEGTDAPAGWTLSGGSGEWTEGETAKGIAVTGTGQDSNWWQSSPCPFEPGKTYLLRFRARAAGATGGTAIAGPSFANRDLGQLSETWQTHTVVFRTPDELTPEASWLRFGQFQVQGKVLFDSVELFSLQPVYAEAGGIILGEGERISGVTYTFSAPMNARQSNTSRPLAAYRCLFNTNRWVFSNDSQVTYLHQLLGRRQTSGTVEITVEPFSAGRLIVSVDNGTTGWQDIGTITAEGKHTFQVPATLYPAGHVSVRLTALAADGGDPAAVGMQVRGYGYRAELEGEKIYASGKTTDFVLASADPRLHVELTGLGSAYPGGKNVLTANVQNNTQEPVSATPVLTITPSGGEAKVFSAPSTFAVGASTIQLPYELIHSGRHDVAITFGDGGVLRIDGVIDVPRLYEAGYGERLPLSDEAAGLWWASSGWKISRERPLPTAQGERVVIRAAKNESEAAQLVIRPNVEIAGFTASAGALTGPGGAVIPESNVSVLRVRYLQTERPTDSSTVVAQWPDPLPPFKSPVALPAGVNQPLWVRVTVPPGVPAGTYDGLIQLRGNGYGVDVPLRVEVFDFELPTRATCTTTFGFSPELVFRYQKVSDPAQRRQVLDAYFKNFSAHRIAPYNPAPLDPPAVSWPALEAYKAATLTDINAAFTPAIDWTAFDAAMTVAIDTYGFNSFVLPVQGMGGGTFHSRTEPTMLGYPESSPEYTVAFTKYHQALQEHLRERGWLDEGYVYWFDEPDPKDYEFVMRGFKRLREVAPDLRLMLTEQPEPGLVGGPHIWCPISDAFDPAKAEGRRAQGEKFWWYVCTGPKAPYATLFLDKPATELRVWLWQTWQRNIDGILVWQSNYWTSDAAYPDPNIPQDPYLDPMSWTTGYDTPAGTRKPWGNGDGRFIYPPEGANGQQAETYLDGPVDSIRWEMLRDGVEDYEYFVMLRAAIEQQAKAGKPVDQYRPLLSVPPTVTAAMTEFTTDPAPLEAHRKALADAIVAVNRL